MNDNNKVREIETIDDFYESFEEATWLETVKTEEGVYSRHTNGLGENTEYESQWFDDITGDIYEGYPDD